MENPVRGDILRVGGAIRKLRHALPGRCKSGGVRVISYWLRDDVPIDKLLIYPKSKKGDLTNRETAVFRDGHEQVTPNAPAALPGQHVQTQHQA